MVCRQVELALAHGEAAEAVLAQLQNQLEAEQAEPLFAFAVKGERALMDRFIAGVDSGRVTAHQMRDSGDAFRTVRLLSRTAPTARATMLRFHNQVQEIARLPVAQQASRLQRLEATAPQLPAAARRLLPSFVRAAATLRRSQTELRCAAAALAAERYCAAHGAWPARLEALVPEYLAQPPADPAGGGPLRYRRVPDGVAIEGRSETDQDAGMVAPAQPAGTSGHPEFRLWDPSQRHQPSKASADGRCPASPSGH
jgi:hypothetical protein